MPIIIIIIIMIIIIIVIIISLIKCLLGGEKILLFKLSSKKIGALICSFLKFLSPEVALYLYINLPYAHVQNTVVTSGLVPPVATWIC